MKRVIGILLFVVVAMIYCGCSENNPLSPKINPNDQLITNLEKQTVYTFFEGTSVTQLPFIDDGRMNILPDGTIQIRGAIVDTDDQMTDDRFNGIITWIVNLDIAPDGSDKRWGSGESEDGQWDLTFKGWLDLESGVTYEVNGHGKGEYRGMKIHLTYLKALDAEFFTVNGYIIEHI